MGAGFLEALRAALPDLRVLTEAGEVEAYRYDETEYLHPGVPAGGGVPGLDRRGGSDRAAGRGARRAARAARRGHRAVGRGDRASRAR